MNETHWVVVEMEEGYRLVLMGGNGEEVMRAMTIYNDERSADHAITLAQRTQVVVRVDEHGNPTD